MTLLLTDGVRHRDSEDEFHITTFFRVRFARGKLLSTLVELLFCYSNNCLRTKDTFIGDHLRRIYLNCRGSGFIDRLSLYRNVDAQERLVFVVFLYGGNIPFVVSLCFASQRIPTACPCCAGSISTIGLAPFCFKPAGLALS